MNKTTTQKITDYISKKGQASGKELTEFLASISSRAVRKQLKKLFDKKILQKIGKPPKVFYMLSEKKHPIVTGQINPKLLEIINKRYLYISPTGQQLEGWNGFVIWCTKTKQNPVKTAQEYMKTLNKYDRYKKHNLIDGLPKINRTFKKVFLDKLHYLDFYSIERFGKTKLGQMLLYAKQSQNKHLIGKIVNEIKSVVIKIISNNRIDGVLFVPPTVKREIQFMKILEDMLRLPVRKLSVSKIKTEIIIPQKTLSKLEDRIENAQKTIIVEDAYKYKNILLIDDAVGSGATMNEIARQIRNRKLSKEKIVGLAITGSFKGFDVISEV